MVLQNINCDIKGHYNFHTTGEKRGQSTGGTYRSKHLNHPADNRNMYRNNIRKISTNFRPQEENERNYKKQCPGQDRESMFNKKVAYINKNASRQRQFYSKTLKSGGQGWNHKDKE